MVHLENQHGRSDDVGGRLPLARLCQEIQRLDTAQVENVSDLSGVKPLDLLRNRQEVIFPPTWLLGASFQVHHVREPCRSGVTVPSNDITADQGLVKQT